MSSSELARAVGTGWVEDARVWEIGEVAGSPSLDLDAEDIAFEAFLYPDKTTESQHVLYFSLTGGNFLAPSTETIGRRFLQGAVADPAIKLKAFTLWSVKDRRTVPVEERFLKRKATSQGSE